MHGCLPSHLIFFLRHSSHALVTLRRFCKGMLGASATSSWTPDASSDSGLTEACVGDLALSDGEGNSSWERSADSSSDISGVFPEPVVLGATAGFLVVLLPRPERGGREGGRAGRVAVLSAAGSVMVARSLRCEQARGFTETPLFFLRVDLLAPVLQSSGPCPHVSS